MTKMSFLIGVLEFVNAKTPSEFIYSRMKKNTVRYCEKDCEVIKKVGESDCKYDLDVILCELKKDIAKNGEDVVFDWIS